MSLQFPNLAKTFSDPFYLYNYSLKYWNGMHTISSQMGFNTALLSMPGLTYEMLEYGVSYQLRKMFDKAVNEAISQSGRKLKTGRENPLYDLTERFAKTKPNWNAFPFYNNETGKVEFAPNAEWLKGKEPEVLKYSEMARHLFFQKNENPESEKSLRPVLVIPPMSGHYATLLRKTIKNINTFGADVFTMDWKSVRDTKLENGEFGLEDYVDNIIEAMELIKQSGATEYDIKAVCQPCPLTIAALALVSELRPDLMPKNGIFVAGPLKVSVGKTEVNNFAESTPLAAIEAAFIKKVEGDYVGKGQRVHMGLLQTFGFMNSKDNKGKSKIGLHQESFNRLAVLWIKLETEGLDETEMRLFLIGVEFWYEYFATIDLSAKFDLETIKNFFQERSLENGTFSLNFKNPNSATVRVLGLKLGEDYVIDTKKIKNMNLISIEGETDDVTGKGQTSQGLDDFCPDLNREHCEVEGGHYSSFNGSKALKQTRKIIDSIN
jgi:poly(3-hydroxybutyrate) depolymerase